MPNSKTPIHPPSANGDLATLLQQQINSGAGRDAAIERIATSVQNLASEFSRKLDEAERDTRKQFDNFSTNVANQFQNVVNKFEAALATRDAKLETVSAEFLKSRQAPWTQLIALGMFLLAFGGSIGWMAYNPINDRTGKVEQAIDKLTDNMLLLRDWSGANFVTQKDLDARTERGKEDRDRVRAELIELRSNLKEAVTRDEVALRGQTVDSRLLDIQRQLDEMKRAQGDIWGARDALSENKDRISELERLIREIISRQPQKAFP